MNRTVTHLLVETFLIAVAANFAWEMAQSVLYAPMGGWLSGTWRCFLASLGDAVIVIGIAGSGWLLFRRVDWFVRPGIEGYLLMAALGILVAVFIEREAIATGRWAYTDRMPIIPRVNVGLAPVLQMVILPPFVLSLAVRRLRAEKERR
jgi:hypothetical protein